MGLIFDVSHFELEIHETASSLIFKFGGKKIEFDVCMKFYIVFKDNLI